MSGYRLAFYCGYSAEPWSPLVVNRGVGGSQESLMAVAATLAQLGHAVRVYNSCGSAAGEYDGVVYQDYRAFDSHPPVDLVIVWRFPWLANAVPVNLRSVLWMKDMIDPQPVIADAHRYRKILIQSRFHRRHYAALPEEKFFYTSNGIQVEHFDQILERDPYKVVFGSSYDRGLFPLLEAWPRVQKDSAGATHRLMGWRRRARVVFSSGRHRSRATGRTTRSDIGNTAMRFSRPYSGPTQTIWDASGTSR